MVSFTPRKRSQICKYPTPEEKLKMYTPENWVFPMALEITTPYHLLEILQSLKEDKLVILPNGYSVMGNIVGRSYMQSGPVIQLPKKEDDFIKDVKASLGSTSFTHVPRGLAWDMNGILAVYPLVCGFDGDVFSETIQGDMSSQLFASQGWKPERVKVTPNYRERNIVCEVPSRSLTARSHILTIYNPPTRRSGISWRDTYIKHVCGDTVYNRELTVGADQTAIEEHDVVGFVAAGEESRKRQDGFTSNFVLPFTREFVNLGSRLVNQIIQLDLDLKSKRKGGKGRPRNLHEYEREYLLEAYIVGRQRAVGRKVADEILFDNLEELQRELKRDNYIFKVLYPN